MAGHSDLQLCLFALQTITEDSRRERISFQPSDAVIGILARHYRDCLEQARALLVEAGHRESVPEPLWVQETLATGKGGPP